MVMNINYATLVFPYNNVDEKNSFHILDLFFNKENAVKVLSRIVTQA